MMTTILGNLGGCVACRARRESGSFPRRLELVDLDPLIASHLLSEFPDERVRRFLRRVRGHVHTPAVMVLHERYEQRVHIAATRSSQQLDFG